MDQTTFLKNYLVDRHNTNSLKWDALDERFGDAELTPMWVADMEFKEPMAVTKALSEYIQKGIYGYAFTPKTYFETYAHWQQLRHKIILEPDWLRFDNGVVASLYTIVNTFTKPDDSVLILTPVYYPFHDAVKDNHRRLVTVDLVRDDGEFRMDFEAIERQIVEQDVKLFIQCSPHNPVGRIWTEAELERILEICQRHNVLVVSDEIHQDMEIGDRRFISSLQVSGGDYRNNLIVVTAASKTFNMAGLLNSHVIIPNEDLRNQFDVGKNRFNHTEISLLGQIAAEAAYKDGAEWLDTVIGIVRDNYQYVKTELQTHFPEIKVSDLQGTYLLWLDLSSVIATNDLHHFIQDEVGIAVDYGEWFGANSQDCIRLNLATDPKLIKYAVDKMITVLSKKGAK